MLNTGSLRKDNDAMYIPSSSRPYFARRLSICPCSIKRSWIPSLFTFAEMPESFRHSRTELPKPPSRVFSSIVTILDIRDAIDTISSLSRGFINRAFITAALMPFFSSLFAACKAGSEQLPMARRAISVPSFRISALPLINSRAGVSGVGYFSSRISYR